MFEKNDRQLLTMRILLNIVTVILVLLGVILGIIYLATGATALGLVLLLLIPFLCWLMWLSSRLFLTYLCDIKLIRNKLYGVDNDILKVFLEDDKDDALILLYNLYEQGILTEEEYTTDRKILKKRKRAY